MSGTEDALVRMANDIARNCSAGGEKAAIKATAEHIELFWDPRMKAKASELLGVANNGLSDIARAALSSLQS